ncbi:MAG: PhoX family phosphatase [Alphaproteobacteria bacterium]|nr:PhoX family phosphatase [Alphaproteobacteria bacterium]MBU0792563.1 PhoX family phosphatase [Alphaproteobacteria bacterium]MBU0874772.1 PhoX family phosphatase [Alphaproteobacteria bacterium]MBU1768630.1 PhoX family phosphatase [Alphaproteobacteria bacterium]
MHDDDQRWPAVVRDDKGASRAFRPRSDSPPLSALISRRTALLGAAGVAGAALFAPVPTRAAGAAAPFLFEEIALKPEANDRLPPGYQRQVVLRWGDPIFPDAPAFDVMHQNADKARRQFGINNDYTAFLPLPFGSDRSDHGLLVVNHEYPLPQLMFPGLDAERVATEITREQVDICIASCGVSVVEVRRTDGAWQVVTDSPHNRRVTADTPIRISGPAAGHGKLRTAADPAGRLVLGTHDNCNGGITPWGTILTCEEGSADFFAGHVEHHPDRAHMERNHYETSPHGRYGWARFHDRFDFDVTPNEPNRFEWVVEIDPFAPDVPPVKRTALGRFAHEGAHCALAADGRAVVYLGDDWEFEYCYRFVSARPVNHVDRAANRDLLDDGILSVARFDADGTVQWLPLVFGEGPLTVANGFSSQGDVLMETRRAADLLGATPMDSPEGFQPHPITGHIFIALTGNDARDEGDVNPANPRPANAHGHILEMIPPGDHAADTFGWRVFLLCGDPANPADGATFHPGTSREGWFVEPDNIGFDPAGRLWVCSDGPGVRGHDGLWVMDVAGPETGLPRLFYSAPVQAECCSPAFTPDGKTMFLSIQHPAERARNLASASTGWPDFVPGMPPRSAVIAISRRDDHRAS